MILWNLVVTTFELQTVLLNIWYLAQVYTYFCSFVVPAPPTEYFWQSWMESGLVHQTVWREVFLPPQETHSLTINKMVGTPPIWALRNYFASLRGNKGLGVGPNNQHSNRSLQAGYPFMQINTHCFEGACTYWVCSFLYVSLLVASDLRLVPQGYQVAQSTQGMMEKILWTALFQWKWGAQFCSYLVKRF